MEIVEDAKAGLVRCQHKKVAIIGAGPTRAMAPWSDDSCCFWGINEIEQPRADRWFELHPMSVQSPSELAWLSICYKPCYTLEHEPILVPGSVKYPLDRVMEATGNADFFACTFGYQIALAITDGFEEIGLFGIDLPMGSWRERTEENACVAYWAGYARGRGILVTVPWRSTLLSYPLRYGYDYHREIDWVEDRGRDLLYLLQCKFDGKGKEGMRVGG